MMYLFFQLVQYALTSQHLNYLQASLTPRMNNYLYGMHSNTSIMLHPTCIELLCNDNFFHWELAIEAHKGMNILK